MLRKNRPRTNLKKARSKTTSPQQNDTEADESSGSEEPDEQEKEE